MILLLNEHRNLVMWLMALVMWCTAYWLYFRNIIWRWLGRNRAHSWSIDMAKKKSIRNGKEEVY